MLSAIGLWHAGQRIIKIQGARALVACHRAINALLSPTIGARVLWSAPLNASNVL